MQETKQLELPIPMKSTKTPSTKSSASGVSADQGKSAEDVLKERGSNYGSFDTHAQYSEDINKVFERSPNWQTMKPDGKEALRIIANKMGRILNGNPEYDDNWRDIAGYATLVCKRIEDEGDKRV